MCTITTFLEVGSRRQVAGRAETSGSTMSWRVTLSLLRFLKSIVHYLADTEASFPSTGGTTSLTSFSICFELFALQVPSTGMSLAICRDCLSLLANSRTTISQGFMSLRVVFRRTNMTPRQPVSTVFSSFCFRIVAISASICLEMSSVLGVASGAGDRASTIFFSSCMASFSLPLSQVIKNPFIFSIGGLVLYLPFCPLTIICFSR